MLVPAGYNGKLRRVRDSRQKGGHQTSPALSACVGFRQLFLASTIRTGAYWLRPLRERRLQAIQFPAAGNFSTVGRINNLAVVAGEYQITFRAGISGIWLTFTVH
jgi:hypothetical protein